MKPERRFVPAGVTLLKRAEGEEDKPQRIAGHAAVFYDGTPATEFKLWSDMTERIAPTAFDRAIKEAQDVRALKNHEPDNLLGRTAAGTLTLEVDARGLAYTIDPPDTHVGRDTVAEIARGDLDGSSFSFRVVKETFEDRAVSDDKDAPTITIRTIEDVDLYDVGPVTFPAYEGADSGLRAADVGDVVERRDKWRAATAELQEARDKVPPGYNPDFVYTAPAEIEARNTRADEVAKGDDLAARAAALDG